MKKVLVILPIIFLFILMCGNKSSELFGASLQLQQQDPKGDKTHHMFVFVHGTILTYPSPGCLISSIKKTLKSGRREKISWQNRFIYELRFKSVYKFQPIQEYGLQQIALAPITPGSPFYYSFLSASLFQNVLNSINPQEYSNTSFYTFGWDGKLSKQSRIENARVLYKSLITEVARLKNIHGKVSVTILAHSHGGNVALNLADAYDKLKSDLLIDQLILIGTPVQSETSGFTLSPLFRKIYSFYSNSDMFQVIDVLSTKDMVSKRRFKSAVPLNNLIQIELMVGKKHPAHAELWLFGNKSNWTYRKNLAIYPTPIFIFIPKILDFIENKLAKSSDLLATIDKKDDIFSITFRDKDKNDVEINTSIMPASLMFFGELKK